MNGMMMLNILVKLLLKLLKNYLEKQNDNTT